MAKGDADSPLDPPRSVFLDALQSFRVLAAAPALTESWNQPSCLDGYTVGGLVGHVLSASGAVERYLDAGTGTDAPIARAAYYAGIPSPAAAGALHRDVLARGEALAARGPDAILDELEALRERLRDRLAREPADRTLDVLGPRTVQLDDYLETRIIEVVVHTDDLAASAGLVPNLPAAAVAVAVEHLFEVARFRHGDLALVRAFARAERDDIAALRVF